MFQRSPRGKNRTGVEASIGMRETVTSLKFKEGEALSKHNLKERDVTTTLPLRGNEKAAHFVVIIKNMVYSTLQNFAIWIKF